MSAPQSQITPDYLDAIESRVYGGRLELKIGGDWRFTNCRNLAEFKRLNQWYLDRNFPDGPKVVPAMTEEAIPSRGE